jgi:hypothetical protein
LTHLRCRLPRLLITAGSQGTPGGEQVEQGLLGDADAAADADRVQLAAGDRLIDLVAPDPQDGRGLAGGEDLGEGGQGADGGAGQVERRCRGTGRLGLGAVAGIEGGCPWLLLDAWCCGRRWPVCPAVDAGGVGPYLDPASRCGVFSLMGGLIMQLLATEAKEAEPAPVIGPVKRGRQCMWRNWHFPWLGSRACLRRPRGRGVESQTVAGRWPCRCRCLVDTAPCL